MEPPKKKAKHSDQLTYQRRFFPRAKANEILEHLKGVKFPKQRHRVRVHGNWHPIPRDQVAYGQPDAEGRTPRYWFSGTFTPSRDWTDVGWIQDIVDQVEAQVGKRPTFLLINRYPDGRSSISYHSDSKRNLIPGLPIVSLTFGAERDFQVRKRGTTRVAKTFVLHHGSLLIMPWAFNEAWQHGVPKRAAWLGPRYNLTFRFMDASV